MTTMINGIEVESDNSCMEDYKRFIKLGAKELDILEKGYYAELRELRHELDLLLAELRQQYGGAQLKCA